MFNKKTRIKLTLVAISAVTTICSCASLERTGDIKNSKLAIGQSNKNEVVNVIGLPQSVEKNSADGTEAWFYTGKPSSTSYFIPMPIAAVSSGADTATVYYTNLGKTSINNVPVTLVCVFNSSGVLVESHQPKNEGK